MTGPTARFCLDTSGSGLITTTHVISDLSITRARNSFAYLKNIHILRTRFVTHLQRTVVHCKEDQKSRRSRTQRSRMQGIGRRSRSGDAEKVCFNPAKVQGKIMLATSTPRKRCLLSCSSASIVETNSSSFIIFFAEGGEKYYKYFVMDVRKSEEIRVKLKAMTYTFGMTLSHNVATSTYLEPLDHHWRYGSPPPSQVQASTYSTAPTTQNPIAVSAAGPVDTPRVP